MALPATDNFNRADGGLGANWTAIAGTSALAISSNRPTLPSGSFGYAYWNADVFASDQYVQFDADGNRYPIAIIRWDEANRRGYSITFNSITPKFDVFRWDTGFSNTYLTSINATDVLGLIRVEFSGGVMSIYLGGVLQGTVNDATYTGGSPGFGVQDTGVTPLDNWEGGNLSAATVVGPGGFARGVTRGLGRGLGMRMVA